MDIRNINPEWNDHTLVSLVNIYLSKKRSITLVQFLEECRDEEQEEDELWNR